MMNNYACSFEEWEFRAQFFKNPPFPPIFIVFNKENFHVLEYSEQVEPKNLIIHFRLAIVGYSILLSLFFLPQDL